MSVQDVQSEAELSGTTAAPGQQARVLHLIGTFAQGGSERQAVQLTGLMKQSGRFDVELAVLDPEGILREEAERWGFSDVPAFPLTSFYDWNMGVQLRRCVARLRTSKIDVVHTHDFYTNVFGMAAAALAGVPVRIASRRELGGIRTAAQRWVERRAYGLAHAVAANSKAVAVQLEEEGVRGDKVRVVYNGLDLRRVTSVPEGKRSEIAKQLRLPTDGNVRFVTIVANFRHAVKDHPTFLRAARRVNDRLPNSCFVLAGEGELIEPMRRLAEELGIADRTYFLGRCDRVGELLAISDVCVLSSKFEGFSNSILEYMAARKPVVATKVGGAEEVIVEGETGYLVRSGDDCAMAERVMYLLQSPAEARDFGERGRRIVEEGFSCAAQLKNTEALYMRFLKTDGQPNFRAR
jgi:glycosyltransferase involved in cell wall biosynthesis